MTIKKNNNNQNVFIRIIKVFLIIVLFPIVLVYLILNLIKRFKAKRKNKDKIRIFSMSQIDTISGVEFEMVLKQIFEKQNYSVSMTKTTGDFGADLVCKSRGKVLIVQAKRSSSTVGARAVQEIIGAKRHYGANDAMVVTNNYFSKEANILAVDNDVKLVDRDVLSNLISKYQIHFERTTFKYSCLNMDEKVQIESKYRFWI